MAKGFVFYEGPSLIDGSPVVAIATWGSKNRKTGRLIQTWIIRSDVDPVTAYRDGSDHAVCGDCPVHKLCYVNKGQAPIAIYAAYHTGAYPDIDDAAKGWTPYRRAFFAAHGVRKGSYGDPAAVPASAFKRVLKYCKGRSKPGYTHQWRKKRFKLQRVVMASVQSVPEAALAQSMGYRTFRITLDESDLQPNERWCPASDAGGNKANCEGCGLCDGKRSDNDRRPHIAIPLHGSALVIKKWRELFAASNMLEVIG